MPDQKVLPPDDPGESKSPNSPSSTDTVARSKWPWASSAQGLLGAAAAVVALLGAVVWVVQQQHEINSLNAKVRTLQAKSASLRGTNEKLAFSLARKTHVVTWTFEQCRVSAAEIQRIDPAFEFPRGTTAVGTQIGYPRENAQVPPAVDAEGTLCGSLPTGSKIWIAVVVPGINGFYPQGSYKDGVGPVTIRPDNTWASASLFVGGPNDRDRQFQIATVLANPQASKSLWRYLQLAEQKHKFRAIPLPLGAEELTRVTVVRK
jgi:hypothetical protein